LEKTLLSYVEASRGERSHVLSQRTVDSVLAKRESGSQEHAAVQAAAIRHLTLEDGRISVLSGLAGTGKTAALKAVREAYEREDFIVWGAALSGKAARGLEDGAGIKSFTIHQALRDFEKGPVDDAKHHARQLVRVAS